MSQPATALETDFEPDPTGAPSQQAESLTLNALFSRNVARAPYQAALVPGPDNNALTFAQCDAIVDAIAARFALLSLPHGSVVGLHMPNSFKAYLSVLGILRAGLVPALLPWLWRRSEIVSALSLCNAKALLVGDYRAAHIEPEMALSIAADLFTIRYVGWGDHSPPDGMVPFGDTFEPGAPDVGDEGALPAVPAQALITFESGMEGLRAITRDHAQMIAGGLAVDLESRIPQGASILTTLMPGSFTALSTSLMMWLTSGGALHLRNPSEMADDIAVWGAIEADTLVMPAPYALKLHAAGAFGADSKIKRIVALWRSPEQVAGSAAFNHPRIHFIDLYAFGEAGHVAATRGLAGTPAPIMPGMQYAPRNGSKASPVGYLNVAGRGTLCLRGPMVPVQSYQVPASNSLRPASQFAPPASAQPDVDTGYIARIDKKADGAMTITAPPAGLVSAGFYRFNGDELQAIAEKAGAETVIAALPDRISGHRIVGRTVNADATRGALHALGVNALIEGAFAPRRGMR